MGGESVMKIDDNGTIREMTEEEIAEMEQAQAETPQPEQSAEEKLQMQIDDLNLIIAEVLGGEINAEFKT